MDWGAIVKFTLIIGAVFVAAIIAVLLFDAVWAQIGLPAAILVLAGGLYLAKRWSDRDAERKRAQFERSR
jgi:membrane protein implicated in regulation of membrane protease activity